MKKIVLSAVCLGIATVASAADGSRFALMEKAGSVEQCRAYGKAIEGASIQSGDFRDLRNIELRNAVKKCEVTIAQKDSLEKTAQLTAK